MSSILAHESVGTDLEEDGFSVDSPEVGDRITAVAATGQQLQGGITTWTQLLWNTQSLVR